MKCFRWFLVLLAFGVLVPTKVDTRRTTFNLADCERTTLENAVTSAADGDVINIPAGSCNWSSGVFINKSITIQGAGIDVTIINNTQVPDGGILHPLINWQSKSTGNTPAGFSKLANMTFNGGSGGSGGGAVPMLLFTGNSGRFVWYRLKVIKTRQESIRWMGYVRGVMSESVILDTGNLGVTLRVEHNAWGDNSTSCTYGAGGCGDGSWAQAASFGTDQAIVFEDSHFESTTGAGGLAFMADGWHGFRTAWRYNTVKNTQIGGHGTETPSRERGQRQQESYRNTIIVDGVNIDSPFNARGGTGIHFDNAATFSNGGFYNKSFGMNTYRADPGNAGHSSATYWPWARCGILPVSSITRSGNLATLTTNGGDGFGHWIVEAGGGAVNKAWITVAGASDGLYNGTFQITSVLNSTQVTYTMAGTPAANASGTLTLRSPFDGNTEASGYRCLDQIGAGPSPMFQNDNPDPALGGQQGLEPYYIFNNVESGTVDPGVPVFVGNAVQENRDFYNQNLSFNGTSGVGRGTLAARPGTCTTGVAYWATDQGEWNASSPGADGQLYKCTSTNVWTLYYVPLTYPHPLLSGIAPESPVVLINSPTSNDHYDTLTNSITITGTATDDESVSSVSYSSDRGPSGSCSFTSPPAFSCSSIGLSTGANIITITATDGTLNGSDVLNVLHLVANTDESDNFDRANWPTLGPWWTQLGVSSPYAVNGNFAVGTGANFDCAAWNQFSFAGDQFSQGTVGFITDTNNAVRAAVRVSGSGALFNAYFLSTDGLSGAGHTYIGKFINGELTALQDIATTVTSTDVIKLEVTGSTLKAYKNDVQIGTDQATGGELTSGAAGVCFYGAGSSFNSWSGGDLEGGEPPPPATSIRRFRIAGGGQ